MTPDGAGFARAAFSPAGPSHRLRTTTSIASASRALVTSVALMLHGISATTHFAGEGQGLPRWPHRRRSKMFHVSHVTSSQTCFSWARTQRMAWSRSRTQGDLRHIIRCKTANGGNKRRGSGVAGGMCERKLRVVWMGARRTTVRAIASEHTAGAIAELSRPRTALAAFHPAHKPPPTCSPHRPLRHYWAAPTASPPHPPGRAWGYESRPRPSGSPPPSPPFAQVERWTCRRCCVTQATCRARLVAYQTLHRTPLAGSRRGAPFGSR